MELTFVGLPTLLAVLKEKFNFIVSDFNMHFLFMTSSPHLFTKNEFQTFTIFWPVKMCSWTCFSRFLAFKLMSCFFLIVIFVRHNLIKYKRFKKMAWIQSRHLHLQWKFKLWAEKFAWGNKAKHCWVMSTNFLFSKVCSQCPAMFWLYTSSKLFRP